MPCKIIRIAYDLVKLSTRIHYGQRCTMYSTLSAWYDFTGIHYRFIITVRRRIAWGVSTCILYNLTSQRARWVGYICVCARVFIRPAHPGTRFVRMSRLTPGLTFRRHDGQQRDEQWRNNTLEDLLTFSYNAQVWDKRSSVMHTL